MPNAVPDHLMTPGVNNALASLSAMPGVSDRHQAEAAQVLAASPWLAGIVNRYPERCAQAFAEGLLDVPADADLDAAVARLQAQLSAALAPDGDDTDDRRLLRIERHIAYLRILWRATTGAAAVEETLLELSALAQAAVAVGAQRVRSRLARRFGLPRGADGRALPLVVIGMGKLGGCELNVSSDIDLIYAYPAAESAAVTDGDRALDHAEWFARESRALTGLLSAVTADGFVFRVDTRLRPFGASGPPVTTLDALAAYWHEHARDWERHAMVKGRALTGDAQDIESFEREREPFVFRPYLDFNVIASLRDLKRLIIESRDRSDADLKLGRGGIRELEFVVQAYQLVRGGHRLELRSRSLLATLAALAEYRLVPEQDAAKLADAYRYLRRAENAVQALEDAQTHELPSDETARERIALALGEAGTASLLATLEAHRTCVMQSFDDLFEGEGIGVEDATDTPEPVVDLPQHQDLVAELLQRPSITRLSEQARERAGKVARAGLAIAETCDACQSEETTLSQRWLDFVAASAGRGGYLQVLLDRPGALDRVVQSFASSAWVARSLMHQPILVDEMLRPGFEVPPADSAAYRDAVQELVDTLDPEDLEAWMNRFRHFRMIHEMRIALAWLDGKLPIMRVSDGLSWLAEALVSAVLSWCRQQLEARFGVPHCVDNGVRRPVSFAVVAYGKLGGLELAHGSDLDLVFLHDSTGSDEVSDGPKSIDNGLWHARLVQKFTHFMTTTTELGSLYETDLRLRPNGSAGVLVTGFEAFARYQRDEAWTWEHQALLRARAISGDAALMQRFEALRLEILCRDRPAEALSHAVADMRQRMYRAHGVDAEPGWLALKRDPGGITDIEFVVQYLALAHAAGHPGIVRFSDNMRVLEAASLAGVIDEHERQQLSSDWLRLRELAYADALALGSGRVLRNTDLDSLLQRVIALRDRHLVPTETPP